MKKILSLTLVLILLLGAVCIIPASSAPMLHYEANGNFSYLGDDTTKTAAIYNYLNKDATEVTIPAVIDGYTVTEICDEAFRLHKNITKITLPDTVTKIGNHAFLQTPLKEIKLSANLEYIGDSAFSGCTMLSSIEFPETLTHIGNYAFNDCCNYAFKEVTIPDSVTYIGYNAFFNCTRLEKFNMSGENLTHLDCNVLYGTPYHKNWDNWENNGLYCGVALLDTRLDNKASYKVKDGTKIIAGSAFNDNYHLLKTITLPDSVEYIGEYCFSYNYALEEVKLSKNIKVISKGAFSKCPKLTNVVIPEGVTELGDFAFYKSPNLEYIKIPQSVTTFGYNCVGYNEKIEEINGSVHHGDVYKSEIITIAGCEGSEAEKYAAEHGFKFKNTLKYKDTVLELLNIPEEDPGTGSGWLAYYNELYSHPASSIDEATPDYVLIKVYENGSGPAFVAERLGDYILRSPNYLYPATFGYVIYLPNTNEVYSLEEAYKLGIKDIEKVFTEGYAGELIGDVNYDRKLNIKDATLIQKAVANMAEIENNYIEGLEWKPDDNTPQYIADFNCDGKMNVRDATAIQKRLAKMDKVNLEHKVVGIYSVAPTDYDHYPEAKAVAKTKEELESILSRLPCETSEANIDATFDDAYFEEHNVIVISDYVGSSCCKYLINNLKLNGSTLTVTTLSNVHGECVPDVYCQCTLIEVDKEFTNNIATIDLVNTEVIIC